MTMGLLRPLLLLAALLCTSTPVASQEVDENIVLENALVDWIRQEGGYFNPKQEFRRRTSLDGAYDVDVYGIFASETIDEGEVLTSVPWKCVFTAGTDEFFTSLHCDTIRKLISEFKAMQKNVDDEKKSHNFRPYLNYLLARPPVDIPSTWSREARILLDKILARSALPPADASTWVRHDWIQDCHGSTDELDVQAAMLVLTRGDDDMLIPLYDLYNHRNGKWHNTRNNVVLEEKHEITASRTIEKGEEIYNSYNHCTNCYNRYTSFGTPEIFRDYGFVEQYPQRWIFSKQKIAFDIDYDDETETGKFQFQWLDYAPYDKHFEVTQDAVVFLKTHLQRLQQFNQTDLIPLLKGTADDIIPKAELENIMQYYKALTMALDMAVKAGESYNFVVFDDDNDDDDDDEDEEVVVPVKQQQDKSEGSTTSESKEAKVQDDAENIAMKQSVVDWIRANGGYFNPNQEFRREKPGDPTSLFGIFATDTIKKGEKLLVVPWKLVMTAGTDDVDEPFYCGTADFIAKQMKLGEKSFYAPYVKYLLASPPVDMPSTWSSNGKKLFSLMLDHGRIPPHRQADWVDDWKEDCNKIGEVDPLELQAAMQLVTRGDDDTLTAVYDMYNHRNGRFFNAHSYLEYNDKHEVVAARTIEKGEQIYISYNQCGNCYNRHFTFGTPEMLRDYGFIESYPQRWVFHRQEIAFDIVDPDDSGNLRVAWLDGRIDPEFDEYFEVTDAGVTFLKAQLRRLKKFNETVLQPLLDEPSSDKMVPKNERDGILQYYEAITTALELAVKASDTYDYEYPAQPPDVDDDYDDDEDDEDMVAPKDPPPKKDPAYEYKWADNDDLDDDEEDDDDDNDEDLDCPAGMVVKGKCVTNIKKWEEL